MSYNLNNARVGDLLVCYLWYALKPEELLGKFIVVSKGSSEANNNKNGESPELTLHVIQSKENYSPISDYVGRNCTFRIDVMQSEITTWNLEYRPGGKKWLKVGYRGKI